MAVPLLPQNRIVEAWGQLKIYPINNVPAELLQKLKNYIQKTWIEQRLHVLSVFGQESRTNNAVESYNARWNSKVVTKNPKFWDLCDKIWESFEDVSGDIGHLNQDPPLQISRPQKIKNVVNMHNLRRAEFELRHGGTIMDFLRKARHTFGKANKRYFKLLLEAIENDSELGGDIQDDEEPAPAQDAGAAAPPEIDNDHLCVICMDREKNAVLIPCGHHSFCDPCGQDLMMRERPEPRCPLCRDPVAQCYRLRYKFNRLTGRIQKINLLNINTADLHTLADLFFWSTICREYWAFGLPDSPICWLYAKVF